VRQRLRPDRVFTPDGFRALTVEHEDGRIVALDDGPGERVDGLLLPGLINAHTHLELSWLRGLVPGGDDLESWVTRLLGHLPVDDVGPIRSSAASAVREAIAFGTVAVGDIQGTPFATQALIDARVQGTVHREVIGQEPAPLDVGGCEELAPGLVSRPSPHAPYSTWPERIRDACAVAGPPAAIHLDEDLAERRFLLTGSGPWAQHLDRMGRDWRSFEPPGVSPARYLDGLGVLGARLALVHMTHAVSADLELVATAGSPVVLCPRSNLHIGGVLPDVPAMLRAGVTLALGTDSLASCPDLDLLAELRCLAAAFPDVPVRAWLDAATQGGAHALGRPDLGAIAVGRRPGLLLLPVADDPETSLRSPVPMPRWVSRP